MNTSQPCSLSNLLPRLARYLPASQFNRLRAMSSQSDDKALARDLLAAVRALDPLYRVLVQYMPRYQLQLDPTPGQPHGEMLDGAFIFADVTGFTALTELLSKQGQSRGAELMNQIMNRLFTAVLDPLTSSGGDLLVFVGDAVLAYFPRQDNDNDVLQAIRAALRLQRAVTPFAAFDSEYGPCSLTLTAGVERGLAYAGVVGPPQRMELLVSGPATFAAMEAETKGVSGQVIVGPQAQVIAEKYFTLQGQQVIDDLGDTLGDYEITPASRRAGGSPVLGLDLAEVLDSLEFNLRRVERLAPFLPEDMLARLVASADRRRQLEAEFRPVATQFIYVVGLEDLALSRGPEFATVVFQRYFSQAQHIVTRHEGVISQIDTYGHGFILLNTFGVPRAHEGTRLYAVSAALELGRALEQLNRDFHLNPPLRQKGGITYGLIFTGEIGATHRRESVVAGPAVNRAARLMAKADYGQVILDADIWASAQAAFVGEKLPAVTLKGIDGPVVIINARQVRRGARLQPPERPLVGRENEQNRLIEALPQFSPHPNPLPEGEGVVLPLSQRERGRGEGFLITGETGLGKTALVCDLAAAARQRGLTVLAGRCQPHGRHIPLFPWLDLLAGWFDLDADADPAAQRRRLAAALASLDMSASENALAAMLELHKSGNSQKAAPAGPVKPSLFAALSDKVSPAPSSPPASMDTLLKKRLSASDSAPKTNTVWQKLEERVSGPQVVIKLLTRLAERGPVVVIIEDIHWLDHESLTLVNDLLPRLADLPLRLVLTSRTPVTFKTGQVTGLPLPPLPDAALTSIAGRALGGQSLDDTLAVWLCQQANGNPLYVEMLCQALQQADALLLDRETGEARWTRLAPTLPPSLRELLLARFEELPLDRQDTLKRAAIIGVSFSDEALRQLCQGRQSEAELEAALAEVCQAGFVSQAGSAGYRFQHALMHETIYETLSFAQRQTWHTRLGDWLAQTQPDALELIAYHYLRGDDPVKAAQLACQAGDKARELGIYAGALDYYEQILALPNLPADLLARATAGKTEALALASQTN